MDEEIECIEFNSDKTIHHVWSKSNLKIHGVTKRLQAGKRILRYVSGTKDLGIMYSTRENFKLIGYTDNENGGSTNDRKSTSR